MAVRVWLPPDFELQLAREADAYRRRFDQLRQQADVRTGLSLAEYADYWPQMEPTAAVALASSGANPLSETARVLAERSVRADVYSGPLGELVNPAQQPPPPRGPRPSLPDQPEGESFGDLGPLGKVGRAASNAFGAFGRGTMLGLGALVGEASAAVSSVGEAVFDDEAGWFEDAWQNFTQRSARSELGVAFGELNRRINEDGFQFDDLYRDSDEFIGSGIMPAGEIARRRETDKERLQLDGQFVTPGRLIARTFSDPGSRVYDTVSGIGDAAFQILGDPLNYVLPGAAAGGRVAGIARSAADEGNAVAQAARRALPGLVSYDERTAITNLEQAREWLPRFRGTLLDGVGRDVARVEADDLIGGTRTGRRLVQWMTAEQSPSKIRELSGGQIPADVAVRIAQINRPDELIDYLGTEVLGARVRRLQAPGRGSTANLVDDGAGGLTAATKLSDRTYDLTRLPGVSRRLNGIRLAGTKPGRFLDTSDQGRMADTFADYMRNGKVAEEQWRPLADELMTSDRGEQGWYNQVNDVVARGLELIAKEGEERGVSAAYIRRMTQQVNAYHLDLRSYAEDEYGNPFGHLGERTIPINGEDRVVPSPIILEQAAREIWSLPDPVEIRRANSAMNRITTTTGWAMTQTALNGFMSSVWAPAQLLRGALTLRVVAENHARMQFSGLDTAFNHPMRYLSWMLGDSDSKLKGLLDKVGVEGQGGSQDVLRQMDEFGSAMSVNGMGLLGRGADAVPYPARELYNGDYVPFYKGDPRKPAAWAQRLAMMAGSQQVRAYVREGGVEGYARWLMGPQGTGLREQLNATIFKNTPIETMDVARRHARDLDKWVDSMTRRDPRLLEEMGGGYVAGVQVDGAVWDTQEIVDRLTSDGLLDLMPETVRGSRHLDVVVNGDARFSLMKKWDQAVDSMFAATLSRPEDYVNRAPTFRQFFAQRLDEAAAYADEDTYKAVREYADSLGIEITATRNGADAFTTLGDLKTMSAADAADRVKGLLYDANKRSNAADVFRLIFPFLEPWRDVVTTWTRIISQNPIALERGRQLTAGVQSGEGMFYENDYGESEFRVPVANWLFNAVAGGNENAQVGATGRTLGLNLIGSSIIPGVGPMVTIPMSVLLPQKPNMEWLEGQLFPYGRPGADGESFLEQVGDAVFPAYFDRMAQAFADPESDRVFANRVMDVMRVLAASGDYTDADGGIGPQQQARLVEDATQRARWLYLVSSAATFVSPTPTNFRFEADTPDGMLTFDAVSREYAALQAEDPTTATEKFLERFGTNLGPLMQSRSYSTSIRQVGEVGARWERANADLEQYAPTTLGVFAPQYDGDDLDPGTFARQFLSGDRTAYTPQQFTQAYNNIIGQTLYYTQRDAFGEYAQTDEGRGVLATYKEQLRRFYPGYDAEQQFRREADVDAQVAELTNAVTNSDELAGTDVGQAIRSYLQLREAAVDAGYSVGGSVTAWKTSNSPEMVALRRSLRDNGERLVRQHPDFAVAFDRIFAREFPEDDPTGTPPPRMARLPRWLQEMGEQ